MTAGCRSIGIRRLLVHGLFSLTHFEAVFYLWCRPEPPERPPPPREPPPRPPLERAAGAGREKECDDRAGPAGREKPPWDGAKFRGAGLGEVCPARGCAVCRLPGVGPKCGEPAEVLRPG